MSNPTPSPTVKEIPTGVAGWENEGGASTAAAPEQPHAQPGSNIMPQTNATPTPRFLLGDAIVVLYDGRYNGMPGNFMQLRTDLNWADVKDNDGLTRPYPVAWLRRPEDLPSPAQLLAEDAALAGAIRKSA